MDSLAEDNIVVEPVQDQIITENNNIEERFEETHIDIADTANEVQESLTSGIDIAHGPSSIPEDETIELGDLIEIISKRYKRVKGRVYYRDLGMIKIMPDGISDRVYSFPLVDDEFDPELGVEEIALYQKRRLNTFVEQHNLRAGYNIETFKGGEEGPTYKIVKVLIDEDAIEIENEVTIRVDFQGIGIPLDADFDVIRMREADAIESNELGPIAEDVLEETKALEDAEDIGLIDEDGFERVDIELTGFTDVAIIQEVEELAAIFRRYPEALQKSDLLTDLLTFLDNASQKDVNKIRLIRSIVEQYALLKKTLLRVDEQGQPKKDLNPTSFLTMKDLTTKYVPLLRPVTPIIKKAYIINEEEAKLDTNTSYLQKTDFTEEQTNIMAGTDFTGTDFYNDMRKYLETYRSLIFNSDKPLFTAKKDQEVFRASLMENIDTIGFNEFKKTLLPFVNNIPFAIDRILTTNYRPAIGEPNKIFMPAEKTTMKEALLFPLESASSIGADRTGSLYQDILRSQTDTQLMSEILNKYEDEEDYSKKIYQIEDRPVGFDDYLRKQPIVGFGPGDFHEALADYGLRENEINVKQLIVFEEKMRSCTAQLINYLREMREKMGEISTPSIQKIFDTEIDKSIPDTENILSKIISEYKKTGTVWSQTDIGIVAELLRQQKDLYLAVLGGSPDIIASERTKAIRRAYIDALNKAYKIKTKRTEVGEAPVPNPCEHVKVLRAVRSIEDKQEQVMTTIQVLKRYQGERKDKMVNCIKCNKHLLCEHEILQLEQAIYPRKSDILSKQLHLEFAGGSFGKHYICKVCGQPFSEVGFDTSIEFDDEGRPMMGRAAIEDKEEINLNEIESILQTKKEDEDIELFDNANHNIIAKIVRTISRKIGIYVDRESMEWIVTNSETTIGAEPDQVAYIKRQQEIAKKGAEVDYSVYMSRVSIAIIASYLLIDIQTKIPNYAVQFIMPGCIPGFSGIPLDSQEDQTGINYISCAIASIMDKEAPWNNSGFQRESNYSKRQNIISRYILSYIKRIITNTPVISKLADKREYLLKEYGVKDGRMSEQSPLFFKPTQVHIESADVLESPADKLSEFILKSHNIARETALLMKGAPFAETNCCIHNINDPNEFWSSRDLPQLKERDMNEMRATRIVTRDPPRPLPVVLAEPPDSIYHRLFLNVCFQGDNIGYPHEVGFDNKCTWCNFLFPESPYTINPDVAGLEALKAQNVDISPQAFQNLLDSVHKNYSVQAYRPESIKNTIDRLKDFVDISPTPNADWRNIMENTYNQFKALNESGQPTTSIQIAVVLGPLSELSQELESNIRKRLGETGTSTLNKIASMSSIEFSEVLNTYFLTPFMRILQNTSVDKYTNIHIPKISYDHMNDIKSFIKNHMDYLTQYSNKFVDAEYSKLKIKYAVEQLSAFMQLKNSFRSMLLPGYQQTSYYIQRTIIFGILSSLCNPTEIPPNANGVDMTKTLIDTSSRSILELIQYMLAKFRHEKLSYSMEDIKSALAIRSEKERRKMIDDFDKMTDDEKQIALTQKVLGIGRFGAERAAAAWKYNANRYDIEKIERSEMGAVDFKEFTSGIVEFGDAMDAGIDYGVGDDFVQQSADDY
jgi:hypothetical protein